MEYKLISTEFMSFLRFSNICVIAMLCIPPPITNYTYIYINIMCSGAVPYILYTLK